MLHIVDALFWIALALVSVVAVVYAISYTYIAGSRDLIETETGILRNRHRAELESVVRALATRLQLSQNDTDAVLQTSDQLRQRERDLRRRIRSLDRLSRAMDVRYACIAPVVLLFVAVALAVGAKAAHEASLAWATVLAVPSFSLLVVSVMIVFRHMYSMQQMAVLQTPSVIHNIEGVGEWRLGQSNKIVIDVLLERGNCISSLQTLLYLPPQFSSSASFSRKLARKPDDPLMPDYNVIPSRAFDILKRDIPFVYEYDRLGCDEPGEYDVYYRVVSAEYSSKYVHVRVVVR